MKSILVVDDDPIIREALTDNFSSDAVSIFEADSSEKAIELMGKFVFNLIVCDFEMPKGNGNEVFYYWKRNNLQGTFVFFTGLDLRDLSEFIDEAEIVPEKNFFKLFKLIKEKGLLKTPDL